MKEEKLKVLSLFSGIGAFEKALENLGVNYELVGFSEVDKYAIQSYCAIHGIDESLNLGDVSKIENGKLPVADLITYGFPCQDISVAGLQKGIKEDTRSGLLYEAERIIEHVKPKYAIAENVKNLVGKKFKEDFEGLLKRLESYGYNNYWKVLNAKNFGIPQNRERVFIISIRKDVDNKRFKFPEPFELKLKSKDLLEDKVEDKYYIDNDRTSILLSNLKDKEQLDNTLIGGMQKHQAVKTDGISTCLTSSMGTGGGYVPMTVEPIIVASRGRNPNNPSDRTVGNPTEQRLELNSQGTTNTLTTVQKDNLVLEPSNELKLFTNLKGGKWDKIHESARRVYDEEEIAPTIPTCGGRNIEPKVQTNYKIRKLTPLECWRLMSFDDVDYFKAKKSLESKFYNGKDRSNSQMYKQAGNSICVNVLESIFKELLEVQE